MGIFSRTKTSTTTTTDKTKAVVVKPLVTNCNNWALIKKPYLTEKAMSLNGSNVYTFLVARNATKYTVIEATKEVYGVTPMKVNIVNKLAKKSLSGTRGRMILETGYKKAYVYLKKGDTINVV